MSRAGECTDSGLASRRYIAERRLSNGVVLERLGEGRPPSVEADVKSVVISGHGTSRSLAREAAEAHFRENPTRRRLLVVVAP